MDSQDVVTLYNMSEMQKRIVKLRKKGMTIFKIAGEVDMNYHSVMEILIELELEKPKEARKGVNKARVNIRTNVEEHQRLIREREAEESLWH